jgi:hypothetical protein
VCFLNVCGTACWLVFTKNTHRRDITEITDFDNKYSLFLYLSAGQKNRQKKASALWVNALM